MESISDILNRAYELAIDGAGYDEALSLCEQVLLDYPDNSEAFRKRAAIHARTGNFQSAVTDLTRGINNGVNSSEWFFFRGWWRLELDDLQGAVDDLTKAIELDRTEEHHPYEESSYFFRAVAFLNLGKGEAAILDCRQVREDFIIYSQTLGRLTRSDVLAQANRLSRGGSSG
ncbi:MAG: tetratricopeptide repeat protein [Pyrinomonadaceae bacterium]